MGYKHHSWEYKMHFTREKYHSLQYSFKICTVTDTFEYFHIFISHGISPNWCSVKCPTNFGTVTVLKEHVLHRWNWIKGSWWRQHAISMAYGAIYVSCLMSRCLWSVSIDIWWLWHIGHSYVVDLLWWNSIAWSTVRSAGIVALHSKHWYSADILLKHRKHWQTCIVFTANN